ncbi:MAG: hypothetical protein JZU65_07750 [Chlorobium sp.]|nr:hypothetical protein [Chlorobium sp.]
MPRPEKVNPGSFKVKTIIYNDGDFSVALGFWDGVKIPRLAMRWNGDDYGDQGYPKSHNHPMWFLIPDALKLPFIGALLPTPYYLFSNAHGPIDGAQSCLLALLRSNLASLGVRKKEQIVGVFLTAEIWEPTRGQSKTVVVAINAPDGPISQDDFEAALKDLLDKLDRHENIENMIFIGGGDLILPDWFYEECRRRGIKIQIITHEESIDEVLNRLELVCYPTHE